MACGLGAVVLLFILLKHDIGRRVDEEDNLSRELASLQLREQQLNEKIKVVDELSLEEECLFDWRSLFFAENAPPELH